MRFPKIGHVRFAVRGLWVAISQETQVQWLCVLTILFLGIAVVRGVSTQSLAVLAVLCALTIASEMWNACFERMCDIMQPEFDPRIKDIKDIASGTTLFLSLISVTIFLFILATSS